jgi:hypothetical protein
MTHPARDALIDFKQMAVMTSAMIAMDVAEAYYSHLSQYNWDINAATRVMYAPHANFATIFPNGMPVSRMLADNLTEFDESKPMDRKRIASANPDHRVRDDIREAKFVAETEKSAAANYDRFLSRLEKKFPADCAIYINSARPWVRGDMMVEWVEGDILHKKLYEIYRHVRISELGNLIVCWRERDITREKKK